MTDRSEISFGNITNDKLFIIVVNHTKWVLQKYPVNACGVRDDLSGDMLMLSQNSLVYLSTNILKVYNTTKLLC